jgi:VanZ family protein
MAGLYWGSSLLERPPTPGMERFAWDDKFQHTAAYAILAALAWRALGPGRGRWFRAGIALLIAAGYGAFDECHQLFVPGRECSFSDWSSDATGAALAAVILAIVAGRSRAAAVPRQRSGGSP